MTYSTVNDNLKRGSWEQLLITAKQARMHEVTRCELDKWVSECAMDEPVFFCRANRLITDLYEDLRVFRAYPAHSDCKVLDLIRSMRDGTYAPPKNSDEFDYDPYDAAYEVSKGFREEIALCIINYLGEIRQGNNVVGQPDFFGSVA